MTTTFQSRRIAFATAVSLTALACSPINAQAPLQDTASNQEVDQEVIKEKKGVRIVKRGNVKWKSKDGELHEYKFAPEDGEMASFVFKDEDGNITVHDGGGKSVDVNVMMIDSKDGKPHKIMITKKYDGDKVKIDVEGGELTKNDEGHDVVVYVDEDGQKHEFMVNTERRGHFVVAGRDGERGHRVMRVERAHRVAPRVRISTSQDIGKRVRIEMERANADIARAKSELAEAMDEVKKEMAALEDKESAEYHGLEVASQAIESAMNSLKGQHFDEKKIQIQVRRMNKELMSHLGEAMKDVHEQREIIVDLQMELHEEVEEAREEMHEMLIEIEEMDDEEEREFQIKIIEEMEVTMGDMTKHRLEALKRAEEELHEARVELERKIAEQKVKEAKDKAEADKEKKD